MTPSAVDLKIVGDRLGIVTSAVRELRALPAADLATFTSDRRNVWAADALLRRAIEALFDTARHVLAKAHGRGGLEYREVARLAAELELVPPDLAGPLVKMAGFCNRLAHYYDEGTPAELYAVVSTKLGDLTALVEALRDSAVREVRP